MNIKEILYIISVPLIIWILLQVKLELIFKKNARSQIAIFYVIISTGIAYLFVNFLYDFYITSSVIN